MGGQEGIGPRFDAVVWMKPSPKSFVSLFLRCPKLQARSSKLKSSIEFLSLVASGQNIGRPFLVDPKEKWMPSWKSLSSPLFPSEGFCASLRWERAGIRSGQRSDDSATGNLQVGKPSALQKTAQQQGTTDYVHMPTNRRVRTHAKTPPHLPAVHVHTRRACCWLHPQRRP